MRGLKEDFGEKEGERKRESERKRKKEVEGKTAMIRLALKFFMDFH